MKTAQKLSPLGETSKQKGFTMLSYLKNPLIVIIIALLLALFLGLGYLFDQTQTLNKKVSLLEKNGVSVNINDLLPRVNIEGNKIPLLTIIVSDLQQRGIIRVAQ